MKSKKQNTKNRSNIPSNLPDAGAMPVGEIVIERPDDVAVVQLREEELGVAKQWTEAGAVIIRKKVETHTETVPVELGYEEVRVERVPANRILAEGERPEPRQEGDTLIVPVVEEEIVVTKRLVVREELRVTKTRLTRQRELSDQVRRERLDVETTGKLEAIQDR